MSIVTSISRVKASTVRLTPITGASREYRREIAQQGDFYTFQGRTDRATFDNLVTASHDYLWFEDEVYGAFHGIMEIQSVRRVGEDMTFRVRFQLTENRFNPAFQWYAFNPDVFDSDVFHCEQARLFNPLRFA